MQLTSVSSIKIAVKIFKFLAQIKPNWKYYCAPSENLTNLKFHKPLLINSELLVNLMRKPCEIFACVENS